MLLSRKKHKAHFNIIRTEYLGTLKIFSGSLWMKDVFMLQFMVVEDDENIRKKGTPFIDSCKKLSLPS